MKNKFFSGLYLLLSIPGYLCIVLLYIYFSVLNKPILLLTEVCKVDKICDWADSIDRFFCRIARCIF